MENFIVNQKAIALFAVVLMMILASIVMIPVYAQNENLPHGGQGTGYVGPTQVPSGVTANLIPILTFLCRQTPQE
jgi:hypothetical protein